jgi:ribosomal protein L11 methyltransferase
MGRVIKVDISITDTEQNDILISALSDMDYYAFEEGEKVLSSYIKEEDFDQDKLKASIGSVNYTESIIEETNWNAKWESEFAPVVVNDYVAVRAHFHQPISNVKYEIIITPKMSFGTGHHATTYLMLQQMEHIDFKGKKVLDFGTGTGVLAILAHRLGGKITAIDNDDWSINNAKENFEVNGCSDIDLRKADCPPQGDRYDIILANINLNIILQNVEKMKDVLAGIDSIIVVSGILIKDIDKVKEVFKSFSLELLQSSEREGWACAMFK